MVVFETFWDWWMALGMWSGDVTRSGKCKQDRLGLESRGRVDRDDSRHDQLEKIWKDAAQNGPTITQPAKKSRRLPISIPSTGSFLWSSGWATRHAIPAGFAYHLELQVAGILSCSRPGFIATIAGSSSDKWHRPISPSVCLVLLMVIVCDCIGPGLNDSIRGTPWYSGVDIHHFAALALFHVPAWVKHAACGKEASGEPFPAIQWPGPAGWELLAQR